MTRSFTKCPARTWRDFIKTARPVMSRRSSWTDIDMKVGTEVGPRFGRLKGVPASP